MLEIPVVLEGEAKLPLYATELASGADVCANTASPITLAPLQRAIVPTGLFFDIPKGYEIQVRPRSGLAAKKGVTVLNTPGTIDADYRGEVKVILINLGNEPFTVEPGMRIAQLVVAPVLQATFPRAETVGATARGTGGFGHTGV